MTNRRWMIKKIGKDGVTDNDLPVGVVFDYPNNAESMPEGWERFEFIPGPPRPVVDRSVDPDDGPIVLCFDSRRVGEECPLPEQCGETNRCLIMLLRDKGWVASTWIEARRRFEERG